MRIKREDLDALMDILWWIKGYRASGSGDCPFSNVHENALSRAHEELSKTVEPPCPARPVEEF